MRMLYINYQLQSYIIFPTYYRHAIIIYLEKKFAKHFQDYCWVFKFLSFTKNIFVKKLQLKLNNYYNYSCTNFYLLQASVFTICISGCNNL